MSSIISRAEAEKRQMVLQDMNKPQQLTVSQVKWKDGGSHPQGATVILSNGRLLNCQVHNVVCDGVFWYVEADIKVKFNDYSTLVRLGEDQKPEALRVANLHIPQSGQAQGTQVILNDGSYLSLLYSVRFVENGLRVKVRIHNETTETSTQTSSG